MGTERFTPVHVANRGDGGDIQRVDQAWGDPVTGRARINSPGASETIKPAGLFSTAPYRPPEPKKKNYGCLGKDGACQARPVIGTDYCIFHTPGRGLKG